MHVGVLRDHEGRARPEHGERPREQPKRRPGDDQHAGDRDRDRDRRPQIGLERDETRRSGARATPIGFASSFTVRGGRLRAARTAAVKTTTASFANSDACTVIGPAAIQRSAPFARMPIPGTFTRIEPDEGGQQQERAGDPEAAVGHARRAGHARHPGQRVAPLTHERPERVVALHDGDAARRAVHHDEPERDQAEGEEQQQVVFDVGRRRRPARGPAPRRGRRIRRHPRPPAPGAGTPRRDPRSRGTGRSSRRRAKAARSRPGRAAAAAARTAAARVPERSGLTPAAARAAARLSAAWPMR